MTEDEMKEASLALIAWFESQEIDAFDTVPILTHTINAFVHTLAKTGGLDLKEGLATVRKMIG